MSRKLEQLRQEYTEMKAVIDSAETGSTRKLKEEEKRVFGKLETIYQVLVKKKNEMHDLKAEVELTLAKGDEFEFLEVSWAEAAVVRVSVPELIAVWTSRSWGWKCLGDMLCFCALQQLPRPEGLQRTADYYLMGPLAQHLGVASPWLASAVQLQARLY